MPHATTSDSLSSGSILVPPGKQLQIVAELRALDSSPNASADGEHVLAVGYELADFETATRDTDVVVSGMELDTIRRSLELLQSSCAFVHSDTSSLYEAVGAVLRAGVFRTSTIQVRSQGAQGSQATQANRNSDRLATIVRNWSKGAVTAACRIVTDDGNFDIARMTAIVHPMIQQKVADMRSTAARISELSLFANSSGDALVAAFTEMRSVATVPSLPRPMVWRSSDSGLDDFESSGARRGAKNALQQHRHGA